MTYDSLTPLCRVCGEDVQGIAETATGSGWMHTRSNRERAVDGHLAAPETYNDLVRGRNATTRAYQRRKKAS